MRWPLSFLVLYTTASMVLTAFQALGVLAALPAPLYTANSAADNAYRV
jgi:hypothetical protein